MGEIVDFADWLGNAQSAATARAAGSDEVDRLAALANVAKVLAHLVAAGDDLERKVSPETIGLGNDIVRALARLDLVSPAQGDHLALRLEEVRQIRRMLQVWRAAIGIRV